MKLSQGDIRYQQDRNALIPTASAHAKKYQASVRRLPLRQFKANSDEERKRLTEIEEQKRTTQENRLHDLAFSNEMQRLAFAAGLIAYDPMQSSAYRSEADHLQAVREKYKQAAG